MHLQDIGWKNTFAQGKKRNENKKSENGFNV